MSIANLWKGVRARWRLRTTKLRRTLEQRVGLDRWYPHVPLAFALTLFGLRRIVAFAEAELGVSWASTGVAHLERLIPTLDHQPIVDLALGMSLVAVSTSSTTATPSRWSTTREIR